MTSPFSAALCGYFGKIPARADFIRARLHRDTVDPWDRWLQEALAESQDKLGSAWQTLFFAAPIWRFILPPGACGRFALMGTLMPSIDAVGRCFPLMLAQEIDRSADPLDLVAGSARWFAAAEALALASLGDGFELDSFDRVMPGCDTSPRPTQPSGRDRSATSANPGIGTWMPLPLASARTAAAAAAALIAGRNARGRGPGGGAWPGIWWTAGAEPPTPATDSPPGLMPCMAISEGLVPPRGFAALLDGRWHDHGWTGRPSQSTEGGNPLPESAAGENDDWERQGRWPNSI